MRRRMHGQPGKPARERRSAHAERVAQRLFVAVLTQQECAPGSRGRAKTGLVLNGLVIVVAVARLMLGGGVL